MVFVRSQLAQKLLALFSKTFSCEDGDIEGVAAACAEGAKLLERFFLRTAGSGFEDLNLSRLQTGFLPFGRPFYGWHCWGLQKAASWDLNTSHVRFRS